MFALLKNIHIYLVDIIHRQIPLAHVSVRRWLHWALSLVIKCIEPADTLLVVFWVVDAPLGKVTY